MLKKELLPHEDHIYRAFLQGMVRLFILHKAGQEPVYGEALNRSFRRFGYHMSPGGLYPLLHTLEKQRLLRCRMRVTRGRVRKYYELTDKGRSCLAAVRKELAGLTAEVIFDEKPPSTALPQEVSVSQHL
jgi:DNA-binding PadR family transcriptional regulator